MLYKGGDSFSFFYLPAHQFAFSNRDDECVDSLVSKGIIYHRLQHLEMAQHIVRNQETAENHIGYNHIIAPLVKFLLCVQKAKGDISILGQIFPGIAVDNLYHCLSTKFSIIEIRQTRNLDRNSEICLSPDLPVP